VAENTPTCRERGVGGGGGGGRRVRPAPRCEADSGALPWPAGGGPRRASARRNTAATQPPCATAAQPSNVSAPVCMPQIPPPKQNSAAVPHTRTHLDLGGQQLEDVVDLVLEAARQHLVGLVQHKHLDGVGAQGAAAQHVVHTPGGAHHHVHAALRAQHGARGGVALSAGKQESGAGSAARVAQLQGRQPSGYCLQAGVPTVRSCAPSVRPQPPNPSLIPPAPPAPTHLQDAGVLAHRGAADARVALDVEVVAQSAHHLLDLLRQLARGGQHQRLALHQGVVQVLGGGRRRGGQTWEERRGGGRRGAGPARSGRGERRGRATPMMASYGCMPLSDRLPAPAVPPRRILPSSEAAAFWPRCAPGSLLRHAEAGHAAG
jgi:hypothetical protein